MGDTVRITIAVAGLVLDLTRLAVATNAFSDISSTRKLARVINDFSPRSTVPTGPM
jgi:hypothetical protein